MRILVQRFPHAADLPLPAYASSGSAGMDLRAAVHGQLTLELGARALVPTGFALQLPPGWEGQVRPRSGLALHHGVTLANSPGTIDSDFRGEVQVILINLGNQPFAVRRGERIAQLVIAPVLRPDQVTLELVEELDSTERGAGGFGSSGRG